MKLVTAFLRLIRWPNLVFIVVTQLLFYYSIYSRYNTNGHFSFFTEKSMILLIVASVFIAAAGYIINDYFDLNIDLVNKPDKLVIEKTIKRRWAIVQHLVLSFVGIAISFYIDYRYKTYWLGLSNTLCVFLLFGYSINLKKRLLLGNILISLLTAWVILVLFFCYYSSYQHWHDSYLMRHDTYLSKFIALSVLYAGFAFIISLVREVIKDMEDMEGDAKYGCRTMPIVWGVPAAKVFTAVWLVVLIGALVVIQFYAMHLGWWWSVAYCVITIIAPLVWILQKLYKAQLPKDYHQLSTAVKLVMLAGILSMIFFKLYA